MEVSATKWLIELLGGQGFTAFGPAKRKYPTGLEPDIVIELAEFNLWVEAKDIWGDWISEGPSGNRVRGCKSASRNIRQLAQDAQKLADNCRIKGDYWGLLGLVFDWNERLTPKVIDVIGPEWEHELLRVPDLCNEADEHFGCTGIVFWREALA